MNPNQPKSVPQSTKTEKKPVISTATSSSAYLQIRPSDLTEADASMGWSVSPSIPGLVSGLHSELADNDVLSHSVLLSITQTMMSFANNLSGNFATKLLIVSLLMSVTSPQAVDAGTVHISTTNHNDLANKNRDLFKWQDSSLSSATSGSAAQLPRAAAQHQHQGHYYEQSMMRQSPFALDNSLDNLVVAPVIQQHKQQRGHHRQHLNQLSNAQLSVTSRATSAAATAEIFIRYGSENKSLRANFTNDKWLDTQIDAYIVQSDPMRPCEKVPDRTLPNKVVVVDMTGIAPLLMGCVSPTNQIRFARDSNASAIVLIMRDPDRIANTRLHEDMSDSELVMPGPNGATPAPIEPVDDIPVLIMEGPSQVRFLESLAYSSKKGWSVRALVRKSPPSEVTEVPVMETNSQVVLLVVIFGVVVLVVLIFGVIFFVKHRPNPLLTPARTASGQKLIEQALSGLTAKTLRHHKSIANLRDGHDSLCSVCLEGFRLKETIRQLPCEHEFHKLCIDRWLVSKPRCPICNFDILFSKYDDELATDMVQAGLDATVSTESHGLRSQQGSRHPPHTASALSQAHANSYLVHPSSGQGTVSSTRSARVPQHSAGNTPGIPVGNIRRGGHPSDGMTVSGSVNTSSPQTHRRLLHPSAIENVGTLRLYMPSSHHQQQRQALITHSNLLNPYYYASPNGKVGTQGRPDDPASTGGATISTSYCDASPLLTTAQIIGGAEQPDRFKATKQSHNRSKHLRPTYDLSTTMEIEDQDIERLTETSDSTTTATPENHVGQYLYDLPPSGLLTGNHNNELLLPLEQARQLYRYTCVPTTSSLNYVPADMSSTSSSSASSNNQPTFPPKFPDPQPQYNHRSAAVPPCATNNHTGLASVVKQRAKKSNGKTANANNSKRLHSLIPPTNSKRFSLAAFGHFVDHQQQQHRNQNGEPTVTAASLPTSRHKRVVGCHGPQPNQSLHNPVINQPQPLSSLTRASSIDSCFLLPATFGGVLGTVDRPSSPEVMPSHQFPTSLGHLQKHNHHVNPSTSEPQKLTKAAKRDTLINAASIETGQSVLQCSKSISNSKAEHRVSSEPTVQTSSSNEPILGTFADPRLPLLTTNAQLPSSSRITTGLVEPHHQPTQQQHHQPQHHPCAWNTSLANPSLHGVPDESQKPNSKSNSSATDANVLSKRRARRATQRTSDNPDTKTLDTAGVSNVTLVEKCDTSTKENELPKIDGNSAAAELAGELQAVVA